MNIRLICDGSIIDDSGKFDFICKVINYELYINKIIIHVNIIKLSASKIDVIETECKKYNTTAYMLVII